MRKLFSRTTNLSISVVRIFVCLIVNRFPADYARAGSQVPNGRRSGSYHVVGPNEVGGKRWTNPKGTQSNSWKKKYRHTKHWPCSCQKKKSRSIYERQTEKVSFAQRTTRKGCERPKSLFVNSGLKAPINCFNFGASLAQGVCAPMNGSAKRRMMPLHSLCRLKHAISLAPRLSSGLQGEHNRGGQPHQRNNEGR